MSTRLQQIERDFETVRKDFIVEIREYETVLEADGTRREVLVPADHFIESPWRDAGLGGRMKVKWPVYKETTGGQQ